MNKRIVIGITCTIAVFVGLFLIGVYKKKRLESSFAVTTGRIYELGKSYKSGNRLFFKFTFQVNNRIFSGNTSFNCDRDKKTIFSTMLVNREMPVVYQKDYPDNCEMLFLKNRFKEFKMEIPVHLRATVDSIESICAESD